MTGSNRPAMTVEVDFVNRPTDVTETWTNITAYCRGYGRNPMILTTQRGRDYELARVSTGVFNLLLDNTDGRFDPNNPASPYVLGTSNPGGAAGLLLPGRRIRIRATWLGVTYDMFRGYVDEWPQAWKAAGFYGELNTNGTDGFAALAAVALPALPVEFALADNPIAFYRLNDDQGSVSAGNSSIIVQPLSTIVASANAAVTDSFAFGDTEGSGRLAGDPTSSLRFFPQSWNAGLGANVSGYALRTADQGAGPLLPLAGGFTVECWMRSTNNTQNNNSPLFVQADAQGTAGGFAAEQIVLGLYAVSASVCSVIFNVFDRSSGTAVALSVKQVCDGAWHHIAATLAADAKTPRLYIDGVRQDASQGGTESPASVALTWNVPYLNEWGGDARPTVKSGTAYFDGDLKNLGLWNSPLSAAQILVHANAGAGFAGDTTGARAARILDAAAWPAALRNLSTGDALQGPQATEDVKALEALQTVADTEAGVLYQDPAGRITLTARSARYNATSTTSLGEQGAELHYQGDIVVQLDNRDIYNDVKVSRTGGITVRVQDSASQLLYFPRTLPLSSTANGDADAVYLAEYLVSRYKDPVRRVPTITLDPITQPALWPIVLGYDIGTCITVSRRPGNAPAISARFFLERVAHNVGGESWSTTWMLSPASVDDVFALDDTTYGHIDGGSTLSSSMTSGTTSAVVVANTTDTTYSTTDTLYLMTVDYEQMTVTAAAAPSAGTQTLTVTRGVNGTVAAGHSAGATVTVFTYGLAF